MNRCPSLEDLEHFLCRDTMLTQSYYHYIDNHLLTHCDSCHKFLNTLTSNESLDVMARNKNRIQTTDTDSVAELLRRIKHGIGDRTEVVTEIPIKIGRYSLLYELGKGSFSRVFLAEDTELDNRLVVLKISASPTHESRLLARAKHPHTIDVYWHGEIDSHDVICMPFLGGTTLSAVMDERRRRGGKPTSGHDLLDELERVSARGYSAARGQPAREILGGLSYPKAIAWIVARLAEALDDAFGRGVLHGDVKLANILLTADGIPMLFDFNLAVDWQPTGNSLAINAAEAVGGTLAYMAPELLQIVADPVDATLPSSANRHRADIYSLGVVLLELLSGHPPEVPSMVRWGSLQELASAYALSRQQGGAEIVRAARVRIEGGVSSILERCLAPDSADRYRRAGEFAEDLDRWRAHRPLLYAREHGLRQAILRYFWR